MTVILLTAGLALLVAGGELLVRGASRLALAIGISPLVVGLTVVAFGTRRLGTAIIRRWPLMTIGCLTVTCELATGPPN